MIEAISAVTLAVRDMSRSVPFYEELGFTLIYGGADSPFSTLRVGRAVVNLVSAEGREIRWWGRFILRVTNADEQYRLFKERGLAPERPRDASWGERYFHMEDPDGHELSFAELLPSASSET